MNYKKGDDVLYNGTKCRVIGITQNGIKIRELDKSGGIWHRVDPEKLERMVTNDRQKL